MNPQAPLDTLSKTVLGAMCGLEACAIVALCIYVRALVAERVTDLKAFVESNSRAIAQAGENSSKLAANVEHLAELIRTFFAGRGE